MDEVGLDRKVVIIGATDVGKTSITMRYCHGSFTTPTAATIGASFLQKRILVGPLKRKMTLQIWDTAGQERFRSMAPMYYRNAKAAILVFDLHNEATFEKAKEWLHDLKHHVSDDIVLALVGNKSDCPSSFNFAVAQQFAREIGAMTFCTSAKSGEGVNQLFERVGEQLLAQHDAEQRKRQRDTGSLLTNNKQQPAPFSNRGGDVLNISREYGDKRKKPSGCC